VDGETAPSLPDVLAADGAETKTLTDVSLGDHGDAGSSGAFAADHGGYRPKLLRRAPGAGDIDPPLVERPAHAPVRGAQSHRGPDADARTHRLLLREGEETGPGRPASAAPLLDRSDPHARGVERLELALKRCGQQATRQHKDVIFRNKIRIAYRNSRDQLVVDQLKRESTSPLRTERATSLLARELKSVPAMCRHRSEGVP
jgi:hypothetical protein